MIYTHIEGGTGAGRKKPLAPAFPHDWKCLNCGTYNKKHWSKCPSCFALRPNFQ